MSSEAYFTRLSSHRFLPSEHTRGAWSVDEQHFSPMAGLITHEMERHVAARGVDDLVFARLSFDILGVVAVAEFEVSVEVVRGGRTIELLEAVVRAAGREVVRARAWRLVRGDTADVAGGAPAPLPPPDGLEEWPMSTWWPGGYIASLEVRPVAPPRPGRTTAWIRSRAALVRDEGFSALAGYVALVDTANGIAVREHPATLLFPNVDLGIHLFREPRGSWVGLDTTVIFGPGGLGLTDTVLHDTSGAVGRSAQALTVRSRR
ncbi:MAG: thioesterase family protein [Candidatus Dormibacteria bacterium]